MAGRWNERGLGGAAPTSSSIMLLRELKELQKSPKSPYFKVEDLHHDNIYNWIVYLIGPSGTCYENGVFKALIRFPQSYPMDPPSLQFLSKMWHPNVYRDGKVCITTLQNPPPDGERQDGDPPTEENWRPVLGVEQVILSVVSMLSDPNFDSPANAEAADQWSKDESVFKKAVDDVVHDSLKKLPDDFEFPVVVETSPAQNRAQAKFDAYSDGEEEEYEYSDDEYLDEDEDMTGKEADDEKN